MRNQYTAEQREKLVGEGASHGRARQRRSKAVGRIVFGGLFVVEGGDVASDRTVFAEVLPMRPRWVRVEVGGAAVVVERGFDAELLRQSWRR